MSYEIEVGGRLGDTLRGEFPELQAQALGLELIEVRRLPSG